MLSIEELCRRLYQVWDSQDWAALDKLVSKDATIHIGSAPPVRFADVQNLKAFYEAFPDGHHEIEECLVANNNGITRCRFTGTHRGAFRGISPTGKSISFTVFHIDRFLNGLLIEHYGQPDMLSLLRQIGAIT